MFIDINTYVGHWPFRNLKYNTLEGLDKLAREYGVTHMVVANLNGFFSASYLPRYTSIKYPMDWNV